MLAENVDHAGDAARISVHTADGVWLKNEMPISTCDAKPLTNVAVSLFEAQRGCPAADGDALTKLTEIVALELDFQLRLACQDNLQKLFARGLKIQEQADFFKGGGLQALSFVNNEHRNLAGTIAFEEPAIEGDQFFAFEIRCARYAEIVEYEIEQVLGLDMGVEDESRRHLLLGKPVKQTANQHGFARADLTG